MLKYKLSQIRNYINLKGRVWQQRMLFHPFTFTLFPILSFWASNKTAVSLRDIWRTLLVCLTLTGVIYQVLSVISKNRKKSALFSSLFVGIFLYFGQVYYSIEGKIPYLDKPAIFLSLWLSFFLFSLYMILRICRQCDLLNKYLNSVSFVLIVFPLLQLLWFPHFQIRYPSINPVDSQISNNKSIKDQPDIYYIIVDGYGRSDILSEFFSLDNSDFLAALQQRGFYIADQSSANYTQTLLSLSSSMTGDYLDGAQIDPASENRELLQRYFDENSYLHLLNRMGYETLEIVESKDIVDVQNANRILSAKSALNNFELGFQSLTLMRFWLASAYEYNHWKAVHSELDILEQLPFDSEHPQFVFIHFLIPHPPFVFDAKGDFVSRNSFLMRDGSYYTGTHEEYRHGYSAQVQYLDTRLITIVDHLLSNPYRPVVIMLQGDHGPGLYWDFDSLENSCLRERLPIFNAYYFPVEDAREELYPSISPVNSLRLVFDKILNQPMPLLEDRAFFSTWDHPFDFQDVTSQKESCDIPE